MSTLFSTELRPSTITPRPFQREAVTSIYREFREFNRKSTLLVLATGLGKTIVVGTIARELAERSKRTLFLVHTKELKNQAEKTFDRLGLDPGIEMAGEYARARHDPDVVIASVQSMQGERLATWPTDHFHLVVRDEAHRAVCTSDRKIRNHFKRARYLGVTATPDRADEDNLGGVFESVAYEMNLWEAMTAKPDPYLCRIRIVTCDTGVDLRGLKTGKEDYSIADLEERIGPEVDTLANSIRQEIGQRQTIVFTPDVGSAGAMASALQSLGLAAGFVAGDSRDRDVVIGRYKAGELQVLCNNNLLVEGFDHPPTSAIVLARPTKSRTVYSQQVGRGTRISPGKSECLVIDFGWLTDSHDLVQPTDLIASTKMDEETQAILDDLIKSGKESDLFDAVQKAEKIHKERVIARVKARERSVRYRRVSYDPLAAMETLGIPMRRDATFMPASEKQIAALERFGVSDAKGISRRRADSLMDSLTARAREGLATMKQVSSLIRNGIDPAEARAMKFEDASKALDSIFGKRAS